MRLWGEEVYGIGVGLLLPAVLDLFDIGDICIEDIILFGDIVYETSALLIQNQNFPISTTGGSNVVEYDASLEIEY